MGIKQLLLKLLDLMLPPLRHICCWFSNWLWHNMALRIVGDLGLAIEFEVGGLGGIES